MDKEFNLSKEIWYEMPGKGGILDSIKVKEFIKRLKEPCWTNPVGADDEYLYECGSVKKGKIIFCQSCLDRNNKINKLAGDDLL